MGVNILVTSQKFYNEYKNDVGFVSNLGDFTNNIAGIIMENMQLLQEVDVSWGFISSSSNSVSSSPIGGGSFKISKTSGDFANDGFSIGDSFLMTYTDNGGAQSATGIITALSNNVIIATGSLPDSSLNGFINSSVILYGTSPLTASIYKFGLIGDSESFNIESKVSANDQAYYSSTVGLGGVRDTSFQQMIRLGQFKDWQTGGMRIRFVSNPLTLFGQNISQRFEIEHNFMIIPYYLDGQLSNLQNNIIPNLLDGLNTIKYAYSPGFRNVLSNPNTEKVRVVNENNVGSVAWFGENFNGFNNDYNVISVAYEDAATTNSADGLLIGTKTRTTIVVERLSGAFSGAERYGVYISYLPSQSEYQDITLTDLKANFLYDRALSDAGLGGVTGDDFITDLTATVVAGDLVIVVESEYSSLQKAFLSNKISQGETFYLLGVQVGDNTLSSGNSDRITLLADVKEYDESADISGLMTFVNHGLFPHDQQIGVDPGFTDVVAWNEDGLVWNYSFSLNLAQQAFLNALEFKLIAFNTITQQFFELDSFSFGVGSAIVSGGIQQLNEINTRGYILKAADQFNDVTISLGSLVVQDQFYEGRYAQKISWQEWLSNLAADTIFYDVTEPNNNLNFKTSNYSLLNNYEIRLAALANVDGVNQFSVSGNTNYLFLSPNLTIYDYEQDGGANIWSCVIETFDSTATTNLGLSVLSGQDTLIRATWTNSGGAVSSLTGLWGINRVEETNEAGYEITEMSSLNLPKPTGQQLLKPSVGSLLDMSIVAGKVVMECLIDGNVVSQGVEYNFSSRIHDANFVVGGKQKSPSGDQKQKGGSSTVKLISP